MDHLDFLLETLVTPLAEKGNYVLCDNCRKYRTVKGGVIQICLSCGDGETDLTLLALKLEDGA